MVFSSFVFLLAFLLIVLFLHYICPGRGRNVVLLVASLIFYAWGEPVYVLIMLFSTVFDYTNGILIEHFQKKNCPGKAKVVLIIDLCGNLGILGFFKYADFFIGNLNTITGAGLSLLHIALPIGISFYTFQTMSYTIDVYRKVVPAQHNILNFATYVTLFPQLIAGPIVQYKTVAKELAHRKVSLEDFSEGAFRFSIGLAKKVLLANQIGSLWNTISQLHQMSAATAWLGAIAYSFQIYFDFSGYSDMAIGLGRMFGFHFLENFNFPYMSKTITEFWRRWHISLSSWFREYVYIPLGGNRKGIFRTVFNLLVVWALTGLWHGASWNFMLWGIYFFVFIAAEKLLLSRLLSKNRAVSHIYLLIIVFFGWILFRFESLSDVWCVIRGMFGANGNPLSSFEAFTTVKSYVIMLIIAVLACTPIFKNLTDRLKFGALKSRGALAAYSVAQLIVPAVLLIISAAALVGDSYNPFLYFRF